VIYSIPTVSTENNTFNSETGEISFNHTDKYAVWSPYTVSIYGYSIVKVRSRQQGMWDCYILRNNTVLPSCSLFFVSLFNVVYNTKCGVESITHAYTSLAVFPAPNKYYGMTCNIVYASGIHADKRIIMSDEDLTKISMIMNVYEGRYAK
jgi:hypothetical protein